MDTTFKGTHGPWSVPHICQEEVECDCAYVLCDYYCGGIATLGVDNGLSVSDGGNDDPPLEEAIYNGYLISAAPDLLEALRWALPIVKNSLGNQVTQRFTELPLELRNSETLIQMLDEQNEIMEKSLAALNKALGHTTKGFFEC